MLIPVFLIAVAAPTFAYIKIGPMWATAGMSRFLHFMMPKQKLLLFALLLACLTRPAISMAEDPKALPLDEASPLVETSRPAQPPDFNRDIYYTNKLEFSLETGALFINTPFVFDCFVGGNYSHNPLHYTLAPIFPSLRWHMGRIAGPGILRGNTDLTATLSLTAIPRGPEKTYGAFDLGVRRNFVHRNWRAAPYFEARGGAGFIDAQGPHGNVYAQGQDFTFTLMVGTGVRYNFSPRYSMSVGATYMHVSNAYLSEPKYYDNGINVVGPIIGFNMRLSRPKGNSQQ
jgi:hypothetical protein